MLIKKLNYLIREKLYLIINQQITPKYNRWSNNSHLLVISGLLQMIGKKIKRDGLMMLGKT